MVSADKAILRRIINWLQAAWCHLLCEQLLFVYLALVYKQNPFFSIYFTLDQDTAVGILTQSRKLGPLAPFKSTRGSERVCTAGVELPTNSLHFTFIIGMFYSWKGKRLIVHLNFVRMMSSRDEILDFWRSCYFDWFCTKTLMTASYFR